MKNILRVTCATISFFVAVEIIGYGITGSDLIYYKFWAPKYQDAQRDVYQHTAAFINGNTADLNNLADQIEITSDAGTKQILTGQLRDRVNHLPSDFPIPTRVNQFLGR